MNKLSLEGEGSRREALLRQSRNRLEARDAQVTYTNKKKTWPLQLSSITASSDAGKTLAVTANGQYNKVPIGLDADLGPLLGFIKGSRPMPLQFNATVADSRIAGHGRITDVGRAKGMTFDLDVQGKQLQSLEPVLGVELLNMGPYAIRGQFDGGASAFRLTSIAGTINKTDVKGDITATLVKPRPFIDARLHSNKLYYHDIIAPKPETTSTREAVIPDIKIPVQLLNKVNMKLGINARHMHVDDVVYSDFAMQAELKDGKLSVSNMDAVLDGGQLNGTLTLDASQQIPAALLTITSGKVDYGSLLETLDITDRLEGQGEVDVHLRGTGDSTRKLLSAANGHVNITSGKGRIKQTKLDLWAADLLTHMLTAAWKPEQEAKVN